MAKKTKSSGISADVIHLPADVVKRAKDLLTGAEKKFFDSSFGASLTKATQAQVQSAVKQARILRNKWRDLYQEQTRSSKRGGKPAAGAGNARTQHKHELFAGAVERFEKRLSDLKEYVAEAVSAPKAAAKPAKKSVAKPAVAKKAKVSAKPVKAISKKARQAASLTTLAKSPAAQAIRFDGAKQRSALTAAKAGRIKMQGLDTQRVSHIAARGRRAQARRDMRSR
jgi:hypothetical protein